MAPGPLFSLIISETLKGDRTNGFLIALAPAATDIPIVILSIVGLKVMAEAIPVLGILAIAGSVFIFYLGSSNFKFNLDKTTVKAGYTTSLKTGIVANFLSPHPYLFWITIGAPTFIKASAINPLFGWLFIFSFYTVMIGSKAGLAELTYRSKNLIRGKLYQTVMKSLGVILILFAVLMFREGLILLGVF